MTLQEQIAEKLGKLTPEHQREVLQFVERLEQDRGEHGTPLRPLRGLWKDLGVHITEEDIAEARREMWGNFPREFPE